MYQEDIDKSLEVLHRGGVILYPTDTVWGIGCDATNDAAIERIYAIKRRCETRAMLTLVNGLDMLAEYVDKSDVSFTVKMLEDYGSRPLTVIYSNARNIAPNLIADDGSLGIRIVNEPFCIQLMKFFGRAIVSTSANISGEPTPAIFDEISEEIKAAVDYIVQWRQDDRKPSTPSSIVKLNVDGSVTVIR